MTSTARDEPTTLEEARLPLADAARLLALADGICSIGQLRTGTRSGQFSIFNFLLRCAPDEHYPAPDERTTYVLLMQAGIIRRHGWFAYFWLPDDERPLRVALPKPIDKSWHWRDDIEEIARRFEDSDGWMEAVGSSVEDRERLFQDALEQAEIVRASTE